MGGWNRVFVIVKTIQYSKCMEVLTEFFFFWGGGGGGGGAHSLGK